jgi:hypothetical protein
MAKPKWSEIQEFGEWLVTRGFETDSDRTRFTKAWQEDVVYCCGADTENYEAFKEVFG